MFSVRQKLRCSAAAAVPVLLSRTDDDRQVPVWKQNDNQEFNHQGFSRKKQLKNQNQKNLDTVFQAFSQTLYSNRPL